MFNNNSNSLRNRLIALEWYAFSPIATKMENHGNSQGMSYPVKKPFRSRAEKRDSCCFWRPPFHISFVSKCKIHLYFSFSKFHCRNLEYFCRSLQACDIIEYNILHLKCNKDDQVYASISIHFWNCLTINDQSF